VNGTEKSILNERKVTPIQKIFEELVWHNINWPEILIENA
jgi:hypothetical protein